MAVSFSRPDPSSPAAVADAAFGTARRGFDQQEVRDFLRMVAAELARLQEREVFLERELLAAQTRHAELPAEIDDETVTRLVGEETTRILQTARESAAQIKAKAEEGAGRLLREATDEAHRQREEADLEAARRRNDAVNDAEAELALAKQQGREMVEEARAYRERVLAELGRRRETAREQIEQLIHGRDRLLEAFDRARLVAVDVVNELTPLSEPEEYVDLSPTTGPIPVTVPASLMDPTVDPTTDELAPVVIEDTVTMVVEVGEVGDVGVRPGPHDEPDAEPEPEPDTGAPVVDLFPGGPPAPAAVSPDQIEEIDDDEVTATDVDDLFARLRAQRQGPADATPPDDEAEPEAVEETTFQRRDAALVPLITASARKLKRALADEQNEVLDTLRQREPVRMLEALVPVEGDHAARYTDAIAAELQAAAFAGVSAIGGGNAADGIDVGPDGVLGPVRDAVAADLVLPLRERLARSVDDGDGDNDAIAKRVRAVYREWKTQRIDDHLDDLLRMAHGRGAFAAVEPGTPLRWTIDPSELACADCEDNSLAGAVAAGEAYPTGHLCAPAHAGCRCLLEPAPQ